MKHNDKHVELEFNLPEYKKKDIKVDLKEDSATVSAQKSHEKKVQKKDFYHEEKSFQSFSYTTTLPKIDPNKAKTSFDKGVLKIKAPKKK